MNINFLISTILFACTNIETPTSSDRKEKTEEVVSNDNSQQKEVGYKINDVMSLEGIDYVVTGVGQEKRGKIIF